METKEVRWIRWEAIEGMVERFGYTAVSRN